MIGFSVAAIPLGMVIAFGSIRLSDYRKRYIQIYHQEEQSDTCVAYTLKRSLEKGDVVSEKDLVEHIIRFDRDEDIHFLSKQEIVGKELKLSIDEGEVIDRSIIHVQDKTEDDIRLHMYSDIELNSEILEGSIVDIRIKFPNGEDYIVASQKRIVKREEDNIFIHVNEEDILRLSSAQTDKSLYRDTDLYAVLYVYDYQNPPQTDYPVNMYVKELGEWTPNLLERVFNDTAVERRYILEENLRQLDS